MNERDLYLDEEHDDEPATPPSEVPTEVPEADAMEQAAPLNRSDQGETDRVDDRPEADALDQDRIEDPAPDEEERR
jgi:hypothetical protein